MPTGRFAPIKRAALFFGCMGLAVAGMAAGSGLQAVRDQSSTSIAAARGHATAQDSRVAAATVVDRSREAAVRAMAGASQQASLEQAHLEQAHLAGEAATVTR